MWFDSRITPVSIGSSLFQCSGRSRALWLSACATVLAGVAWSAIPAQSSKPSSPHDPHGLLAHCVGTWDVDILAEDPAGGSPTLSHGVETHRLICGGRWKAVDFEGEFQGTSTTGHGVMGFDPEQGDYVLYWFDDYAPHAQESRGSWDAESRSLEKWSPMPTEDQPDARLRQTTRWVGDDAFVLEMDTVLPDGTHTRILTMEGKRRDK